MYPSDLTDAQWVVLEPILLRARGTRRGRPIVRGLRNTINAILYVVKTGWCQGGTDRLFARYTRLR